MDGKETGQSWKLRESCWLQEKVERFESFGKDDASSLKVLDEDVFCELRNWKHQGENEALEKISSRKHNEGGEEASGRDRNIEGWKALMELYQGRKNLRFYGIREASGTTEENVKEVLVGFMQNELDISEGDTIEFQRIHRIGRPNPSQDKPSVASSMFLVAGSL